MQTALDSDSLVQEIEARTGRSDWNFEQRQSGPAIQKQARRAVGLIKQRQSRRCNEIYNFKLTCEDEEVRLHSCLSIIDKNGKWSRSMPDQHCRYDGQPFDGVPAAIPRSFNKSLGAWEVEGCFCSWSCAKSWLKTLDLRESEYRRRLELLSQLAALHFGQSEVHSALPLEALRIFGGYLELDEWREAGQGKNSTILYEPPLEPLDMIVLERMHDWEARRQRREFYHGRTLEERKQKEQQRQIKIDADMRAAAEREAKRQRLDREKKNNLIASMGLQIVD